MQVCKRRLKERALWCTIHYEAEDFIMSIATYRGVKYDTNLPKQEYMEWLELVQSQAGGHLIYRGHDYRPHHQVKTK